MSPAPFTLSIKPGVDTVSTSLQTASGMQASNLVRFLNHQIEKQGGCTKFITSTFGGTATHITPWAALDTTQYVGLGTTTELDVIAAGALNNITPDAGVGSGQWSLDKWGQNLLAAPAGGTIYQWTPPSLTAALPLTNAPSEVNGLIVAAPQQQIIAWGAHSASLGQQDPLLVAWCDVANNTVWTADSNNQAGTFRLSSGSIIRQILWTGLSGLIWTDLDMWSMTYASFPLIYGFNQIAANCGSISSRSADRLGTRVPWMGENNFFLYQGGSVRPLECGVWDQVFDRTAGLDRNFLNAVHCDTNTYFGEFTWRYPRIGSAGVCDAYVKWLPSESGPGLWDYGVGDPKISSWADASVVGQPVGTDYTGHVLQFETSNDYDGAPLNSGFTSGWIGLAEGEQCIFLERVIPDFTLNATGQITLVFEFADMIAEDDSLFPIRTYGPYTVTQQTPYIIVRGGGRYLRVTLSCTAADTFWRWGKPLGVLQPDGRP